MMSMKRCLALFAAIALILALAACGGKKVPVTSTPTPTASAAAETTPPTASDPGQKSPENVGISFIMQEYHEDGDIIEIPYFVYDGAKDEVLDSMNRLFNQDLKTRYDEFVADPGNYEWMEIRTYPFTSEQYVQVVVTSVKYSVSPDTLWSGTVESVNYDKANNKWIRFSDLGIKEDYVITEATRLYLAENKGADINSMKITGFLIRPQGGLKGDFTEILLEANASMDGAEPNITFYAYCPDTEEFYHFNPEGVMPFSHVDMDQMEPPLYYDLQEQQIGGEPIADGVIYTGSQLEGDSGENMPPYEAVISLYDAVLKKAFSLGSDYNEEDPMYIACIDVMEIDGMECYRIEVNGVFGNKSYAVNYNYENQNIYEVSERESRLLGSIPDLGK